MATLDERFEALEHEHRFVLPPPGEEQTIGQCSCGLKREFSRLTWRPFEGCSITRRPRMPPSGIPYGPLLQSVELDLPPDGADED